MEYAIFVSLYSRISVFEIIQWAVKFCTGSDTKILTMFIVCLSFVWVQYNISFICASSHMKRTSNFDLQKTIEIIF
jgi:hypothetical protein